MARPKLQVTPPPPEESGQTMWRDGDQVQAVQPHWLLPGRIPANALAVVEGDSSAGKSTFLCHLIASITTGKPWLERKRTAPANVLWVSGEEDFGSMIRPRLEAAGADVSRVKVPNVDDDGVTKPIYLPANMRLLRDAAALYDLSAIVIEPLVSFVPHDLSLTVEGHARAVVDPLNRLAMEAGCAVIITRGLRKDRSGPRLSHGSGHPAIANTARSVIVIDRPDELTERRVLRTIKYALSPTPPPPLEYHHEKTAGAPRIVGLNLVAGDDDAAADALDPGERSVRTDARELLRAVCATDYVPVTVIQAAAEASGLGWRTVVRVKAELQVHSRMNRQMAQLFHEWGPPLSGWPPPHPPVRSTPCALPRKRKSQTKPKESGA